MTRFVSQINRSDGNNHRFQRHPIHGRSPGCIVLYNGRIGNHQREFSCRRQLDPYGASSHHNRILRSKLLEVSYRLLTTPGANESLQESKIVVIDRYLSPFPPGSEEIILCARKVFSLYHFDIVSKHHRVHIDRRPITFSVLQVIIDHFPLGGNVRSKEISFHKRRHHIRSPLRNVPIMSSRLGLDEDFVKQAPASCPEDSWLHERIFVVKVIRELFAL